VNLLYNSCKNLLYQDLWRFHGPLYR